MLWDGFRNSAEDERMKSFEDALAEFVTRIKVKHWMIEAAHGNEPRLAVP